MINKIKSSRSDVHSLNPFQGLKKIEQVFTHSIQHRIDITHTGTHAIAVGGELTFATVSQVLSESQKWFNHTSPSLEISFEKVTHVDSAVLALLIEWKRLAKNRGCLVHLVQLPESVRRLAELSQITDLLEGGKDG